MASGEQNLDRRHAGRLVDQRTQSGGQNRQNFNLNQAPVGMWVYSPDIRYPQETNLSYPVEEGTNYQQAHMTYSDVEADHISLLPLHSNRRYCVDDQPQMTVGQGNGISGIGQQSASGFSNHQMNEPGRGNLQMLSSQDGNNRINVSTQRNVGRVSVDPLFQQDMLFNSGIGQQSASGFSNDRMNNPGGHLQMLSSSGNGRHSVTAVRNGGSGNGMDRVVRRDMELMQKLRLEVENYDDKMKKCIKSFADENFDRDRAQAYGIGLLYKINVGSRVKCLECHSQADTSDTFQHLDDCVVNRAMKETGYASSDEDSLPQKSDSDVSMESEENDQSSREILSELNSTPAFQTLNCDDSLFSSGRGASNILPTDEKSLSTVAQLQGMGYDINAIETIFKIHGQKCLKSLDDFLELEEKSKDSVINSYTSAAPTASVPDAPVHGASAFGFTSQPSDFATAREFSSRETPYSSSGGRGSGDVFFPPTLCLSLSGQTVEITGAGDVSLDFRYCAACKREHACVTQEPCGHVVCKTCGDPSNPICKVCQEVVTLRGCFDIWSIH